MSFRKCYPANQQSYLRASDDIQAEGKRESAVMGGSGGGEGGRGGDCVDGSAIGGEGCRRQAGGCGRLDGLPGQRPRASSDEGKDKMLE